MKGCFVFMLPMLAGTLFLPLSAFNWDKKPAATVEGVLGENVTLEWKFSLVSTNETFDYFLLLKNVDDMIKYSHDVGVVIYDGFTGSVGLAANGTPAFILTNLKLSDDKAKFCCKVGIKRKRDSRGYILKHCVVLNLLVRPSIVEISRNQTLNESNDVTLSCNVTGTPLPNVRWSKTGDQDNKYNPGSFLSLRNISRRQDGLYWCTAENGAGKSTASVRVTVQYAPSITVPAKSFNLTEGGDVELVCAADGRPRPVVTWAKIGESSSLVSPDKDTLNITNANRTEAGTYRCTATNGIGKDAVATVKVIIFYKPTATHLTSNVTRNAVIRSFPVTFHCWADSVPPPVLELRFKNSSLGHFVNGKFTIDQVKDSDQGMYECLASNNIGVGTTAKLNLTVLVPPSIEYISHDTTATEGDNVKLFCNSTGNPRPNITWTHLNDSGARIIMTGETLTLSNVTRNQAGTYQCTATNNIMTPNTANVHVTINYPPGIKRGPTVRQPVNESGDLELFCNATGNPPPNITWSKAADPSVQLSVDEVLKVKNISKTDSGVYQCRVSNGIGSVVLASVNVTVNYKPTASRLTSNVTGNAVIRNLSVTFHCWADSVPPPVLELRFKNSSLGNFIDGQFTIDRVRASDEGKYECVPSNIIGAGPIATLNLTVVVSPSIEYISSDTTVNETDDVKLFCNSTGKPHPNITWTFLKGSNARVIRTGEALVLSAVRRNQAGAYRCAAANGVTSPKTAYVHITINYKPTATRLTSNVTRNSVIRSFPVTFYCRADSVPPPLLELRFKNSSLGHFVNGKFTIDQVKDSNQGMYECLASNNIGVGTTAKLNLTVLVPPSIEFISHDTTTTEGDYVKLFCNSTGNPRPNITWTHLNGSGARIIMTGETLTLSNVTRNQAGTYQCTATNNILTPTTANVHVMINYPPGIKRGPTASQPVNESGDLELFCNATGNPPPNITWSRAADPSVQLSVDEVLKVRNISKTDSGVYQCRASNGIGSVVLASVNVTVNYKPTAARLTSNVTGNAVIRNLSVTFHCWADSVPPPVLELRFKNSSLGNFIDGQFTIDRVRASDEGKYECVPSNIIGAGPIATLDLSVVVPPSIEYISSDTTVNESDDVKLFCNSTGRPYPNITWKFLKGSNARVIRTGEALVLSAVRRNQAGAYRCTAANGVTSPKTAYVYITINYKPEIKDNVRTKVNSWINHETKVTCEAEGVPTPDVTWTRNGVVVSSIQSKPGVKELKFTPEGANDFGDYECTAKNPLGSTKKIISIKELVAPEAPEILRIDLGVDNMEIHWQASISKPDSPVLDYLVKVKEKDQSDRWRNCTEVQTKDSSLMCIMNDLKSGTVYIVEVAARNVVGYSAFTETEAQTTKPAVIGKVDAQKQQQLSRGTIDGIIAGVICFCSLVVVTVAIVTQRRPCDKGCNKDKVIKSSEECITGHENPAMEENPETVQSEEGV
ncbi:hypothetical protein ACROYT_G028383 [Oculina patagonica]